MERASEGCFREAPTGMNEPISMTVVGSTETQAMPGFGSLVAAVALPCGRCKLPESQAPNEEDKGLTTVGHKGVAGC